MATAPNPAERPNRWQNSDALSLLVYIDSTTNLPRSAEIMTVDERTQKLVACDYPGHAGREVKPYELTLDRAREMTGGLKGLQKVGDWKFTTSTEAIDMNALF